MLLIDAHVHIYDCFDFEFFFNSAFKNFEVAAEHLGYGSDFKGILFLTETSKNNWFHHLFGYADDNHLPHKRSTGNWKFYRTKESCSLVAKAKNSRKLFLIAGRQVVSAEGLEVLALMTRQNIENGSRIRYLIREIKKQNALPVIPWGFGKWFGRKGKILKTLIESSKNDDFFLGDNGGRPKFMHRPSLFNLSDHKGVRILAGTDPLPLKNDNHRAGSFGFGLRNSISNDEPGKDLSKRLLDPNTKFESFGSLQRIYPFIRNQIKLRLKFGTLF